LGIEGKPGKERNLVIFKDKPFTRFTLIPRIDIGLPKINVSFHYEVV